MKLQTEIKLKKQDGNLIDYHSKLLLLGSCFSENIGEKFNYFKFQSVSNPFGILFHPKAIETLVVNAVKQKDYSEKDIFYHNEQWHCYHAHSKLSSDSKEVLLSNLNDNIKLTNQQISESTHIIITIGTAWVYDIANIGRTVSNCHKVPQKKFRKRLLSINEIVESIKNTVEAIHEINKKVSIIFTVSPVRHIKDGFIESTQSKSHLIAAIHQFLNHQSQIGNHQSFYFPSYELMLDELRDYRFYKSDMLHPNKIAIQYIWEKFQEVWINSETIKTMKEVDVIQKGLKHKPFNANSQAHVEFILKLKDKQEAIQSQYPQIVF